jgi:hypothetical protein
MSIFNRYEAQTERAYHDQQEAQAIGEIMAACAKAIFDSQSAETMEQLQRHIYKYNACGPAVSFELHEGACEPRKSPFVYVGDPRAETITEPWLAICKIGISSIVEGSDAEVPLQWLDLEQFANDEKFEGDLDELCDAAVTAFGKIVEEVNDEACALWEEANEEPLWHALD